VSVPAEDADVLRDLLVAHGTRTVVEIGLAYGASALAIGEALAMLPNGAVRHVVIDPHQSTFNDAGWDAILSAGLGERTQLIREQSQWAALGFLETF
jgi:predicted O-methyltransferase YrrM